MKIFLLLVLAVTACTSPADTGSRGPSKATIARIERKLVQDPCSGPLGGMVRTYAYPWRSGSVDDRTIFVTLQRHRVALPDGAAKWGIYDTRNDRLTLAECAKSV